MFTERGLRGGSGAGERYSAESNDHHPEPDYQSADDSSGRKRRCGL